MPLTKTSFKTGERKAGRAKGTPNKIPSIAKERVTELLDLLDSGIADNLEQLTPKERVDLYVKLLEFVMPKMARVEPEASDKSTEPQTIKIEFVGNEY